MSEAGSIPATKAKARPRAWILWLLAGVIVVLLYFGIAYLIEVFTHESTDDAFIAGHIVSVSSRIAGPVTSVLFKDNQLIHSNDLLWELDPADFTLTVALKAAAAESQSSNYKTILAAYQLMETKVTTAKAASRRAQDDADAAAATAQKSRADFERAKDLQKQNTLSRQEFDAAQAAHTKAQADWKSALENAAECASKVEEAQKQLAAAYEEAGMAMAQWQEAQTNVAMAKLTLSYTKTFAPAAGRVTRKAVEAGDYVAAGQPLLSLVAPEVWVVANFKESQLGKMAAGQPVVVEIDALGGRSFAAHVDSIQAGSGAAFSLLPPENATGNFVKVIQRVPVKIIFDDPLPANKVIGPGLSVMASVQVSKFVFPAWGIAFIAAVIAGKAALIFIFVTGRKASAESSGKPC